VAVTRRRSGTLVVTRFTTVDERGAPVTTTDYGSVYRGVPCDGEAHDAAAPVGAWTTRRAHREPEPARAKPVAPERWADRVAVAPWTAHVYT
jgi:hypothetical protein